MATSTCTRTSATTNDDDDDNVTDTLPSIVEKVHSSTAELVHGAHTERIRRRIARSKIRQRNLNLCDQKNNVVLLGMYQENLISSMNMNNRNHQQQTATDDDDDDKVHPSTIELSFKRSPAIERRRQEQQDEGEQQQEPERSTSPSQQQYVTAVPLRSFHTFRNSHIDNDSYREEQIENCERTMEARHEESHQHQCQSQIRRVKVSQRQQDNHQQNSELAGQDQKQEETMPTIIGRQQRRRRRPHHHRSSSRMQSMQQSNDDTNYQETYNSDRQDEQRSFVANNRSSSASATTGTATTGIRIVTRSSNDNSNWNVYNYSGDTNGDQGTPYRDTDNYNSNWNDNRRVEFMGFIPMLRRVVSYLLQMYTLLTISAISYYIMYHCYVMPRRYVDRPLYFDYSNAQSYEHKRNNQQQKDGTNYRNRNSFDYTYAGDDYVSDEMTASTPTIATAIVDLTKYHDIAWDVHYIDTVSGPDTRRTLDPYQSYYIEIILHLPDTNTNRIGGMFGIRTELYTKSTIEENDIRQMKPHVEKTDSNNVVDRDHEQCHITSKGNIQSKCIYDSTSSSAIPSLNQDQKEQENSENGFEIHPNVEGRTSSSSSLSHSSKLQLLASSHRSSMYPYVTSWIDQMQKVLFLVPLLLNSFDESKTVHIFTFRHYIESLDYPLVSSFLVTCFFSSLKMSCSIFPPTHECLSSSATLSFELVESYCYKHSRR
jgi:Putative adipose-regulatory protein (Seipin)